jgi:hypothetical protein
MERHDIAFPTQAHCPVYGLKLWAQQPMGARDGVLRRASFEVNLLA